MPSSLLLPALYHQMSAAALANLPSMLYEAYHLENSTGIMNLDGNSGVDELFLNVYGNIEVNIGAEYYSTSGPSGTLQNFESVTASVVEGSGRVVLTGDNNPNYIELRGDPGTGLFDHSNDILIYGGAGDDVIVIDSSIRSTVGGQILPGSGDDTVIIGSGESQLIFDTQDLG